MEARKRGTSASFANCAFGREASPVPTSYGPDLREVLQYARDLLDKAKAYAQYIQRCNGGQLRLLEKKQAEDTHAYARILTTNRLHELALVVRCLHDDGIEGPAERPGNESWMYKDYRQIHHQRT